MRIFLLFSLSLFLSLSEVHSLPNVRSLKTRTTSVNINDDTNAENSNKNPSRNVDRINSNGIFPSEKGIDIEKYVAEAISSNNDYASETSHKEDNSINKSAASVYLTVTYCPTQTQGEGAIIKVGMPGGNIEVVHKFEWPSAIFGCPLLYDPTVTHSSKGNDHRVLLDFTGSLGTVVEVDLVSASVVFHTQPQSPFFSGFTNMEVSPPSSLIGLSPTVTESGLCSDGCYQFGSLGFESGAFERRSIVPFKAALDDAHFDDGRRFWFQGSYDLRPVGSRCGGANNATMCLVALDRSNGALVSAKETPSWTGYKFAHGKDPASGNVTAWVNGFDGKCNDPYNDFAFATVDLERAEATLKACISKKVTVHMDEWIADFSPDLSMMATASGSTEAPSQLLVFHVGSASTVLDMSLKEIAKALGAYENMFEVWDVAFF